MTVLLNELGGHGIGVNLDFHPASRMRVITEVGGIVENGDGCVIIMPAGVVLPREVGCVPPREIMKGVVLAAEMPQDVPCLTVDI